MIEYITTAVLPAFWFGILMSISPCPLATNIAAVSFIGRRSSEPRAVLITGMLYTAGRMIAYLLVAIAVIASLLSVPDIARALQEYMNIALGPLLIIIGLIMLNILKLPAGSGGGIITQKAHGFAERSNYLGALVLGVVFALSFCPVSAGLFFGSLIPLSINTGGGIALPLVFGIGTALPVIIISFFIAFATHLVGKIFDVLTKIEKWGRLITGIVFIIAGAYLTYEYIFSGMI